jgi:AbrB family looped-hinge helix DNA binding protein
MRSRIDRAGRLVIPKALRNQLGLRPGEVELTADGEALRVITVHDDALVEDGGRLVIPASGVTIGDELVQALRDADRRSWAELEADALVDTGSPFLWS